MYECIDILTEFRTGGGLFWVIHISVKKKKKQLGKKLTIILIKKNNNNTKSAYKNSINALRLISSWIHEYLIRLCTFKSN